MNESSVVDYIRRMTMKKVVVSTVVRFIQDRALSLRYTTQQG
jgi:hypothetical protein